MNHMRLFSFFSFIALVCVPILTVSASSVSDVGFVESAVWFSPESFAEGDSVRIHTAIWNGEEKGLSGTAHFFDKETLLAKRTFSVPPGTLESVSIDWRATAGDHAFSVRLLDTRNAGGEVIVLSKTQTVAVKKTVAKAVQNEASVVTALETLEDSETVGRLTDQIGKAETFVAGVIPDSVMQVLGSTFEPVEVFRGERIDTIKEKKDTVKEELLRLEAGDTLIEEESPDPLEALDAGALYKPIRYIYLVFLGLLGFIYSHAIVFYVVVAYIAFVIFRFVYRKLFVRT